MSTHSDECRQCERFYKKYVASEKAADAEIGRLRRLIIRAKPMVRYAEKIASENDLEDEQMIAQQWLKEASNNE